MPADLLPTPVGSMTVKANDSAVTASMNLISSVGRCWPDPGAAFDVRLLYSGARARINSS